MKKVLLAMSGGVDSSAALVLLKSEYEVIGATLDLTSGSAAAAADARKAAEHFNIPHYVFDFKQLFREKVIGYFNSAWLGGLTPNPCVVCNRTVKFGALLDEADKLGCDYIATGHYARVRFDDKYGCYAIKKAVDKNGGVNPKDQSYVLYGLTQEQLSRVILPLGTLTKSETRRIAAENGLETAAGKPESQDICFIPDGDYAAFIERETGVKPQSGDFTDISGNILGRHSGFIRYTPGQRRGLGISGGKRLYVINKDIAANTVTVGSEDDLYAAEIIARELNWVIMPRLDKETRFTAKTRYGAAEHACTVIPAPGGKSARVVFDKPVRAAACGQSVVFYDGEVVAGGGIICG